MTFSLALPFPLPKIPIVLREEVGGGLVGWSCYLEVIGMLVGEFELVTAEYPYE